MTRGIVSALNREINYNGATMTLIQTDASINEGNSGGPLFNSRGQVIGITNMKMISSFGSGVEGLGFAIPSDTVESIVQALIEDGAVYGRVSIGVTVGPEQGHCSVLRHSAGAVRQRSHRRLGCRGEGHRARRYNH